MTRMNFNNGPTQSIVNLEKENSSYYLNQIREIENDHVVDNNFKYKNFEGHVTSDICNANFKEDDVVKVNGEEATDIQQVLSLEWYQILTFLDAVR